MIVTTKLKMDLDRKGLVSRIDAVQGDTNTRALVLALYAGGIPWQVPEDIALQIRYRKPDRTGGIYDTLPDGTRAWQISGNTLSLILAPQMLTEKGEVKMQVQLLSGTDSLATFTIFVDVEEDPAAGVLHSGDYVNMRAWLTEGLDNALQTAMDSGAFTPQLQLKPVKTLPPGSNATASLTQQGAVASLELGLPAGSTPEKGVDYWTETDQQSMRADIMDAMYPDLAVLVQSVPEFANDLSECTDTTKLYVLPDGMLYAWMKTNGALYTNLAEPNSSDWAENHRMNSSGALVAYSGAVATNWIPVKAGDVLRIKGLNILDSTAGYMWVRKTDGTMDYPKCASFSAHFTTDDDGVISYTIHTISDSAEALIDSIRLSGILTADSSEGVVITLNESLISGEGYFWRSTGHAYQPADYEDRIIAVEQTASTIPELTGRVTALEADNTAAQLPEYWQEHLQDKVSAINSWQAEGGKDCFSFPVMTDLHTTCNLGMRSGLLARTVMDKCFIRYALCLGDVVTRGVDTTAEAMLERFAVAEQILRPIRDSLLQTQGNHDGAWGAEDLDSDGDVEGTEYYCHNFTPQQLHNLIYRRVGMVADVHFDASGSGYYVDDVSNKVRYILLNSHNNPYAENDDGTALYNSMRIFRFGQSQYDLLVTALNGVPGDDWAVVTASHVPISDDYGQLFAGEQELLRKILKAYKEKTPFTGSFAGTYGADAVSIQADFTGAKGQYIAHFAGHSHADTAGVYDGITVITTRCDAQEENDAALNAERLPGTTTEQSFDVFTVDRNKRIIYATKIGAGEDRAIEF